MFINIILLIIIIYVTTLLTYDLFVSTRKQISKQNLHMKYSLLCMNLLIAFVITMKVPMDVINNLTYLYQSIKVYTSGQSSIAEDI